MSVVLGGIGLTLAIISLIKAVKRKDDYYIYIVIAMMFVMLSNIL